MWLESEVIQMQNNSRSLSEGNPISVSLVHWNTVFNPRNTEASERILKLNVIISIPH